MKRIVCEMCDGWDFIKQDGLLVCQGCGCKYPVAEAKKLMVDIPDEPTAPSAPSDEGAVTEGDWGRDATPAPAAPAAPAEPAPVAATPTPAPAASPVGADTIRPETPIATGTPVGDGAPVPPEPAPVAATPTPTAPEPAAPPVGADTIRPDTTPAPAAPAEPAPVAADPIPTGENRLAVRVLSLGHRQGEGQFLPGPDLAGNIGARILLENQGPKTLRYAGVYLRPLTAQGGETGCMVRNHTVMGIRIAEPVEPETQWEGICTGMWCNRFITAARIDRVEVLYTDGTTQTFAPADLSPFQA